MKAKQNHYETLGVKPDASPEEIKRVFLDLAKRVHPDKKTGDESRMMVLNHALDVLSDPERRAHYDKTGEDRQATKEEEIQSAITTAFMDALQKDAPDALAHARELLQGAEGRLREQIEQLKNGRAKLSARRDRITRKSGTNLFTALVDQQISGHDQQIERMERDLEVCRKVCKAALAELKQYKSTEEMPIQRGVIFSSFGATTGTI